MSGGIDMREYAEAMRAIDEYERQRRAEQQPAEPTDRQGGPMNTQPDTLHPDWLALGQIVLTVRRGTRGVVHYQAEVKVVRHTKTSVFVSYLNSDGSASKPEYRYVAKKPRWSDEVGYYAVPRYLDYVETLERKTDASSK